MASNGIARRLWFRRPAVYNARSFLAGVRMTFQIDDVNRRYGIAGQAVFNEPVSGFPVLEVTNAHAQATIALQGAQVMTWTPNGERPVIWLSRAAKLAAGKSIRGGVPVCWPWFGPHPSQPTFPSHGFARTVAWDVVAVRGTAEATEVRFRLSANATPRAQWPQATELELFIRIGRALDVELTTRNKEVVPVTISEALHTYFEVSDIGDVAVHGLDGLAYIDKVDRSARKQQAGPVTLGGEVDRIYLRSTADCVIDDAGWRRRVRIAKSGSRSTVVWNPWIDKAAKMGDLGDDGYRHMLCVESANAADDAVEIGAGGEHTLGVRYSVERLD